MIAAASPAVEPTPTEDAIACVAAIEGRSKVLSDELVRRGAKAAELRNYIDRVRNSLQALEGCVAALEHGS